MTPSPWRKSSRSGGNGGQCVEARAHAGRYQLRDSKLGERSPVLGMTGDEFAGLLTAVKASRFDG